MNDHPRTSLFITGVVRCPFKIRIVRPAKHSMDQRGQTIHGDQALYGAGVPNVPTSMIWAGQTFWYSTNGHLHSIQKRMRVNVLIFHINVCVPSVHPLRYYR